MTAIEFNSRILQEKSSLKNFALSLTHNIEDALDLLQDTYVKAITYREKFEDSTNIKAWLLALSVVSGWVIGHDNAPARLLTALPIFMLFGLASNLTYVWIGASLRHWLRGPNNTAQRLQWFNRLMALTLFATVVWMTHSALSLS